MIIIADSGSTKCTWLFHDGGKTTSVRTRGINALQHTPEQIRECYAMAREEGFAHINMDLIVGLPGETIEDVAHTLEEMKKIHHDGYYVKMAVAWAVSICYIHFPEKYLDYNRKL